MGPADEAGPSRWPWHALPGSEALATILSDPERGLSAPEAAARLARHGPNALPEPPRRGPWVVFLAQFRSPLIYLLFGAAAIALVAGHRADALVIAIVVVVNALIGAFQEGCAERSIQALRRLATHEARVVRDGRETLVAARELVPGDVLVLEAGDAVAADARLLDGTALQIAEAALTGESLPVAKELPALAPDTPLADRRNMVYAGTHVTAGRARALVVETGSATEIGRIAALAESAEEPPTPLERRVARFGRQVMLIAAAMFVVVLALGRARAVPPDEMVMIAISQVVGMIPEGLPVAMTIALAVGVQRMARRRAVVRHLTAVEALGATTVVCSDKTGTLTRNELTVTTVALPGGRELAVGGTGYEPRGDFLEEGRPIDPARDRDLAALLEACVLCNNAELRGPEDGPQRWRAIGDPTEVALLVLAIKGGLVPAELRARWPRRAEIPFDAAAKMMATQHAGAGGTLVALKGAPELVLELCRAARRGGRAEPLDEAARSALRRTADEIAGRALRVLAVALVEGAEVDGRAGFAAFRRRALLLGFVGQIDPPRPETAEAVRRCRAAGIRPVMVTGDHLATGAAVARQLDIARAEDELVDGAELERLPETELTARVGRIAVFARVHPTQKLGIVRALQARGEVVTMTGDGVNDAPALVRADVGVAMGLTGTEVAKEAADMVIGDDDFATIVAAVEEGRVVQRNLEKALLLLVSTSVAEVLVLLLAMLLGYPPPFAAVQILWNNLVTEGLVTVNLVLEGPEGDEMRRAPLPPDRPLLHRRLLARIGVVAPTIVALTLGWFAARLAAGVPEAQVRTETFTLLALCEWFNVLNCRSELRSGLDLGLLRNRWLLGGLVLGNALQVAVVFWAPLGRVFHTVPFGLQEALALAVVASVVLWVEELRKLVHRRREARQT
jgi:Ca2+-transporting ATPase